jgi:hypothetical protein
MSEKLSQEHECESLPAHLQGDGVVGVSQLRIIPAFEGPTICTLVYLADAVRIDVVDCNFSPGRFRGAITRALRAMRNFGPLESWDRLRAASFAAPSCSTLTCDGVSYRHAVLDWQGGTEASWSNPSFYLHLQQYELAHAYHALIASSGILLEHGSHVRIRTGLMAGFIARVEWLDRYKGRLRVVAELGGKPVSVDLAVSDIEFSAQ